MTWARLDDNFADDPTLLRLPRSVRLLYVEGIVWCCKHLTDGLLEQHVLRRVSDEPDLEAAAALLIQAGLWEAVESGYRIVDFLAMQPSKDSVEERRAEAKERQDRSRRHRQGDHSKCLRGKYCPEGGVTRDKTRDTTRESQRESQQPDPTRPDPSRPKGKDGEEDTSPAARCTDERCDGTGYFVDDGGGEQRCSQPFTSPAHRAARGEVRPLRGVV
jgi:hypothetical protein